MTEIHTGVQRAKMLVHVSPLLSPLLSSLLHVPWRHVPVYSCDVQERVKAAVAGQRYADGELLLAAVRKDGRALQYASAELQADRGLVLAAVRKDGRALQYASAELQADRELVLAAVRNGRALKYASAELQADRELVLAAVRKNGRALKYASAELQADREVLLLLGFQALFYAPAELRAEREFVLTVVQKYGSALDCASAELRDDREVVLAAVQSYSGALRYASAAQQADYDILLTAARSHQRDRPSMRERWGKFLTAELPLLPAETLAEFLKSLHALEGEAGLIQDSVDEDVFDKLLAHLSPDLMTKRSTWVDMRSLGGSVEIIGEDYDDEEWDVDWRGPVWDEVFGA